MKSKLTLKAFLVCLSILILFVSIRCSPGSKSPFQAEIAFRTLSELQSIGPRTPVSASHALALEYISDQLKVNGWLVQIQTGRLMNHPVQNIIATRHSGKISTILASHYDSRLHADKDPKQVLRSFAVPGANDGGSSTVVLLELSRILDAEVSSDIALVFFDAEDQGNISGWNWILGSKLFVQQLEEIPDQMVLLDMVGGFEQTIVPPSNSNAEIYREIQAVANKLGYEQNFQAQSNRAILDDHVPFIEAGVPAIDLIDIIDPRWHTTADDLENVSVQSLQRVGDTLFFWIHSQEKPGIY